MSLKVLSAAAALVLISPMAAPTASFAQNPPRNRTATGWVRSGGAPAAYRFGGTAPRTFNGGIRPGAPVAQSATNGGNWRGAQGWRGDRHDRDRGFIPGLVTGAVIGGAIASQSYGYYDAPGYSYAPGDYEDQPYDDSTVAASPAPADDAIAYCIQNYSSYDPASGSYLGNDGLRHPCP
jgi:BA14K-like protein